MGFSNISLQVSTTKEKDFYNSKKSVEINILCVCGSRLIGIGKIPVITSSYQNKEENAISHA